MSYPFLHLLTPEEKKRYDTILELKQENKEMLKIFRIDYNKLKSSVKALEKKYGTTEDFKNYANGSKNQFVIALLFKIENKYRHIEHKIYLYKARQKHFSKVMVGFPFKGGYSQGSMPGKISDLYSIISSAQSNLADAWHDISIANKYLKEIAQGVKWRT
jgi:hypothetical protein